MADQQRTLRSGSTAGHRTEFSKTTDFHRVHHEESDPNESYGAGDHRANTPSVVVVRDVSVTIQIPETPIFTYDASVPVFFDFTTNLVAPECYDLDSDRGKSKFLVRSLFITAIYLYLYSLYSIRA